MWDNFKAFLAEPFHSEMDAMDWFLFVGFLIAVLVMWNLILYHIKEGM